MFFKLTSSEKYLIVDLEATCCDKNSIPRKEFEIIEIGAVIVESVGLTILDEFSIFVKPVIHPDLTSFCTELTSIQQTDVDSAVEFPHALSEFEKWFKSFGDSLFCSWGDYDRIQFEQDCKLHQIKNPMGDDHVNIKKEFSLVQGSKKQYGLARALKMVGLEFSGTHHRGIDDARNMVGLMPYILRRKKVPR